MPVNAAHKQLTEQFSLLSFVDSMQSVFQGV